MNGRWQRPKGPWREVMHLERVVQASTPAGGSGYILHLECGHDTYRKASEVYRGLSKPPVRRVRCITCLERYGDGHAG